MYILPQMCVFACVHVAVVVYVGIFLRIHVAVEVYVSIFMLQ